MASDARNLPQLSEIVNKNRFIIRNARPDDCPAIVRYIKVCLELSLLVAVQDNLFWKLYPGA